MSDVVQKIKDQLNIVDVVSAYVELHKAGRNFKGKSPFTNEKTPSFYVSPDRGMYYCFSTSQGGDIFTFIQAMEGVDFKEALKTLAQKANVELVPISPKNKDQRDRLYVVMEAATQFYQNKLVNAKSPQDYLASRGLNTKTIESWKIGFAPGPPDNGWSPLKDFLLQKNFTENELLKAGLIKISDNGRASFDVFRNRIVFPLFDQTGRVVAFSGRTIESGSDIPKYVNSPETDLYKKSELLYGYDRAKQGIRTLGFSIIVEGQFDVVMSHQSGYANTVAVSGTALTLFHVQQLERLSTKVVLALDSDKAGLAAVKRAADLMLRRGLDVKITSMPKGQDPADMVSGDVREYKKAIGYSLHVIEFLIKNLLEQNLDERTFKLKARDEIIPYIALLPNHIDQDHFETKLAESLKTTKEAIHYELERLGEAKKRIRNEIIDNSITPVARAEVKKRSDRQTSLLTFIVASLHLHPIEVSAKIQLLLESLTGKLIDEIKSTLSKSDLAETVFRLEESIDKHPKRIFEDEFIHSLNQLRSLLIKSKITKVRKFLEEAQKVHDIKTMDELMAQISILQQQLREPDYQESLLRLET